MIFPKYNVSSHRVLRIHWSANNSEEFIFDNGLESFQDASHGTDKVLRSSYGIDKQTFMDTECVCKVHHLFLPTNNSDAELRALHKDVLRGKQHRLILTSIRIPTSKPTKVYEYNEAVVYSVLSHRITPRLRNVDIFICYLRHEHGNSLHEAKLVPSRVKFSSVGTRPECGLYLMRSSSIGMDHVHLSQLPQ